MKFSPVVLFGLLGIAAAAPAAEPQTTNPGDQGQFAVTYTEISGRTGYLKKVYNSTLTANTRPQPSPANVVCTYLRQTLDGPVSSSCTYAEFRYTYNSLKSGVAQNITTSSGKYQLYGFGTLTQQPAPDGNTFIAKGVINVSRVTPY